MAEVSFTVAPTADDPAAGRGPRVRRRLERHVVVPAPKPLVLQGLALVLLLGVTSALVYLLTREPAPVAAAFVGAGLVMSVFCLLVWASGVLGLGVGPSQLLALLRSLVWAIRDSTARASNEASNG